MKNSSIMMQLLNNAMLNSTLIRQGTYISQFEVLTDPLGFLEDVCSIFELQIQEKQIQLEIDSDLKGDVNTRTLVQNSGIMVDL